MHTFMYTYTGRLQKKLKIVKHKHKQKQGMFTNLLHVADGFLDIK